MSSLTLYKGSWLGFTLPSGKHLCLETSVWSHTCSLERISLNLSLDMIFCTSLSPFMNFLDQYSAVTPFLDSPMYMHNDRKIFNSGTSRGVHLRMCEPLDFLVQVSAAYALVYIHILARISSGRKTDTKSQGSTRLLM